MSPVRRAASAAVLMLVLGASAACGDDGAGQAARSTSVEPVGTAGAGTPAATTGAGSGAAKAVGSSPPRSGPTRVTPPASTEPTSPVAGRVPPPSSSATAVPFAAGKSVSALTIGPIEGTCRRVGDATVAVRIRVEVDPEAPTRMQALPEAGWTRAYAVPQGPIDWVLTFGREIDVAELPTRLPDALFYYGNRELGRLDLGDQREVTARGCGARAR